MGITIINTSTFFATWIFFLQSLAAMIFIVYPKVTLPLYNHVDLSATMIVQTKKGQTSNCHLPNTFFQVLQEQVRQKPSPSEQKPSQAPEAPPTKRLEDMAATSPTVEPPRGNSSCSDVTEIPKQLDANFEKLDTSNSVRPTILGELVWLVLVK